MDKKVLISGLKRISDDISVYVDASDLDRPVMLIGIDDYLIDLAAEIFGQVIGKRANLLYFRNSQAFRLWKNQELSGKNFTSTSNIISVGDQYPISKITQLFAELNYEKTGRVWQPGEFSLYGDVFIVWIPGWDMPVRLSFFHDDIESIDLLDPDLRSSLKKISKIDLLEKSENRSVMRQIVGNELSQQTLNQHVIYIRGEHFNQDDRKLLKSNYKFINLGLKSIPGGDYVCGNKKAINNLLTGLRDQGFSIRILIEKRKSHSSRDIHKKKALKKANNAMDIVFEPSDIIEIIKVPRKGFISQLSRTVYLTEYELSGRVSIGESADENLSVKDNYFGKIDIGDYVVHEDHGIGVYAGVEKGESGLDYLVISYADNDRLLIPYKSANKLAKFLGGKKVKPRITKLSGGGWKRTTKAAKKDAEQIARELLQLYSMRQLVKAPVLIKNDLDTQFYNNFADSFEHEDTEDQVMVSKVVAQDLKNQIPMDRLLIGDVGFGKTEIAARAIFAAINSEHQAVMLAPTTVLVEQHKAVLQKRFEQYNDFRIESLSRLTPRGAQKKIISDIAAGEIDLIIGTHSLLSDRINYQSLGLVVIDEEQKFGVKHKEKIKAMRLNAHTLSMTATPIPRTLHMSLSGIRDISVIATPPPGRKPIINKSHLFNWEIVQGAINHELDRNGQVYFLHNRVASIDKAALKVQELFPDKTIDVAHGQMAGSHLASVMKAFARGDIDVLVCTTIIENGLDLENVNTLIIDDVEKLGLAQMYQIRGRIGRSDRQAFAYFLYKNLRGDARLRLEAIEEFEELGSGFLLANRDLKIRGAGSILGKEQSGRIHSVGYSLYMKMLREAVEKLKKEKYNSDLPDSVKHENGFTAGGWIR